MTNATFADQTRMTDVETAVGLIEGPNRTRSFVQLEITRTAGREGDLTGT